MKIVVGGPMNCGKSTFAASIYKILSQKGFSAGIHGIDVFSDTVPCILGYKPWADRQKREAGLWQQAAINSALNKFCADRKLVVLGDLPGFIDIALEKMVKPADVAIVLGKNREDIEEWSAFFKSKEIPTVLKIISCTAGKTHCLDGFAVIQGLDRTIVFNEDMVLIARKILAFCVKAIPP